MITANFYTFNKRNNSTKVPTGTGTSINIVLKDDVSILNPTIRVSLSATVLSYNYCYIPVFSRYYFITDIVSSKGFWEIELKCDVLASYKTQIGSMNTYVLRSAHEMDGNVIDTIYPVKANEDAHKVYGNFGTYSDETTITDPFKLKGSDCCYVVGIASKSNTVQCQAGSTVYYLMTPTQMQKFMTYLMTDVSEWSDISISRYDEGVQRALLNPIQYIQSCVMFPFTVDKVLNKTDTDTIYFGAYSYTIEEGYAASMLYISLYTGPTCQTGGTIDVTRHPQAETRGMYLNGSPFTEYYVHIGPAGDFQINPNSFIDLDIDTLTVTMKWDLTSGLCRIRIEHEMSLGNDNNDPLLDTTVQGGVNINLTQAFTDPLKQGLTLASAAGNLISSGLGFTPGSIGGIISATSSGVGSLSENKFPKASGVGTSGAMLNMFNEDSGFYISCKHDLLVDENYIELGSPLCKVKTISSIPGFILCSGADFGGAGTENERNEINNYLNTGFFYE